MSIPRTTTWRTAAGGALAAMALAAFAQAGVPAKDTKTDEKAHRKCEYSTQECLNYMAARLKASGWIGIEYDPEKDNIINRVIAGSPAEKAGLVPGDRLFALNGVEIKRENSEALEKVRKEWAPGQTVTYTIDHEGQPQRQVTIVLGTWPADILARWIGEHMLEHAEADAAALNSKK